MQTINDIDTSIEEGRLLLAALAILTTSEGYTNKSPDEVLALVAETALIAFDETIEIAIEYDHEEVREAIQYLNQMPPEINKPINYNELIHGTTAAAERVKELIAQGSQCVVAERVHNGHMFIGWKVHDHDEPKHLYD